MLTLANLQPNEEKKYEDLVKAQPGIEKHLRALGIGPGMIIYVAPAESRDYYLTRNTGGTDGRYFQSVYKDQRDPGVGKNARCSKVSRSATFPNAGGHATSNELIRLMVARTRSQ